MTICVEALRVAGSVGSHLARILLNGKGEKALAQRLTQNTARRTAGCDCGGVATSVFLIPMGLQIGPPRPEIRSPRRSPPAAGRFEPGV
jgi:hypothetical protein